MSLIVLIVTNREVYNERMKAQAAIPERLSRKEAK
jgi:hypothetical protein